MAETMYGTGFSSKEVRRAFVRKVYGILAIQLSVTALIIGYFHASDSADEWVNETTVTLSAGMFSLSYFTIICCPGLRRSYPANLILLIVFTIAMAFMTATWSLSEKSETVLIAAVICTVCCIAVTVFASNTACDVTEYAGVMLVLLLGLIVFGFFVAFWGGPMDQKLHAGLSAVIFMVYLALDTQMIMGGKKLEIEPEEHIYAALHLYMDIIILFKDIVRLLGDRGGRR